MVDWWNGLDTMLKVLYCIAAPASLLLIIQTILSIAGGFSGGAGIDLPDTSGLDFGGVAGMDAGSIDMGELADGADGINIPVDGGNPADFNIGSMFTVQGVVTFLTVFSWSSIVGISSGVPQGLSVIAAVVLGILAMYALAKLIFASAKLTENGTIVMKNAIGESGKVYIPIPPGGSGEGKVNLFLQGRFTECSAICMGQEMIKTGTPVRVVDVRGEVLVVEEDK